MWRWAGISGHITLNSRKPNFFLKEFEGSYAAEAAMTTSKVNLDSRVSGGLATLTLTGPPDKWFALALGSPHFDMADKPYTIVVDGKGNVQERKLGDHDPGQVLTASIRVLSNSVVDGHRQVLLYMCIPTMLA